MPIISNIFEKAKEKNILSGIIIVELITFISYLIFPSGILFFGDLHIVIGISSGVYFGLKRLKKEQSEIKTGLTIGLFGALLAAISLSLFEWILFVTYNVFSIIDLLLFLIIFIFEALIIGLPISIIISLYFSSKKKRMNLGSNIDDKFYESLREN
jgi:hypothetical protein